jgi:hypothetical protein
MSDTMPALVNYAAEPHAVELREVPVLIHTEFGGMHPVADGSARFPH